jgi:hypothetical protein
MVDRDSRNAGQRCEIHAAAQVRIHIFPDPAHGGERQSAVCLRRWRHPAPAFQSSALDSYRKVLGCVSRPDANSASNIEAQVKEGLQGCVPSLTELRYRLRWSAGEYPLRDQSIEWH